jgi:hypothetical protein
MQRYLSLSIPLLGAIALAVASDQAAAQIDPGALDAAETNVCVAKTRVDAAVAGAAEARRSSVPVEDLTGERIDDPARRQALQRSVDRVVVAGQDGLVASFRDELARAQAEHRRLTGSTFNTARCNGAETRLSHTLAAERQREAQMNAQVSRAVQQHEAGERAYQEQMQVDTACTDRKALELPADVQARLFPPGYVNDARARYAAFTSAYQRRNGRPFDPAVCP